MLFRRDPFFNGGDNAEQLVKIAKVGPWPLVHSCSRYNFLFKNCSFMIQVLGTEEFDVYLKKYGLTLDPKLRELIGRRYKKPWSKFISDRHEISISSNAFDLLNRLLKYDHHERLTCKEALAHPFFDVVRESEDKN